MFTQYVADLAYVRWYARVNNERVWTDRRDESAPVRGIEYARKKEKRRLHLLSCDQHLRDRLPRVSLFLCSPYRSATAVTRSRKVSRKVSKVRANSENGKAADSRSLRLFLSAIVVRLRRASAGVLPRSLSRARLRALGLNNLVEWFCFRVSRGRRSVSRSTRARSVPVDRTLRRILDGAKRSGIPRLFIIRSSEFSRGDVKIALHPLRRIGLPCWTRLRVAGKVILHENLFSSLALPSLFLFRSSYHAISFSLDRVAHTRTSRLARRTAATYTRKSGTHSLRPSAWPPIGRMPVADAEIPSRNIPSYHSTYFWHIKSIIGNESCFRFVASVIIVRYSVLR